MCCSPWSRKESDVTEKLNWTEIKGGGRVNVQRIRRQVLWSPILKSNHVASHPQTPPPPYLLLGSWPPRTFSFISRQISDWGCRKSTPPFKGPQRIELSSYCYKFLPRTLRNTKHKKIQHLKQGATSIHKSPFLKRSRCGIGVWERKSPSICPYVPSSLKNSENNPLSKTPYLNCNMLKEPHEAGQGCPQHRKPTVSSHSATSAPHIQSLTHRLSHVLSA